MGQRIQMEKKNRPGSLRSRLFGQMFIALVLAYIATISLLLGLARVYFYRIFYNTMKNHITITANYYQDSVGIEESLNETVLSNFDSWWRSRNSRVQIYDPEGTLVLDSQGSLKQESPDIDDVTEALKGGSGTQTFYIKDTGEHVMSVAMPLIAAGKTVGAIRNISSLSQVDANMLKITGVFLLIGGMVFIIAHLFTKRMLTNFTEPILSLTDSARQMAHGNYHARNDIERDDEIGELASAFNHMGSEIENKENLKNKFISSVSHELRTPLTAIKGWASTLKDPETDRDLMNTGLDIIENESDRLKELVNELLDFSKFSAGKIDLKISRVFPEELSDFSENFLHQRVKRENKKFSVELQEGIKPFYGDENRLKQVLINLLDNSMKFTEAGDLIKLSISQDKDNTRIEVYDTGSGIEDAEIGKVTKMFFKGRHSKASSGIGLAITREIIELHGGQLIVQSKVNEYTRMSFTIPREVRNEKKNSSL